MKYENVEKVNALIKQIKKDEKELEKFASYRDKPMKIVIVLDTVNIATVGIGDFEHPHTKMATSFIEDCIQDLRDKITASKNELELL